jgi:hypothetical protein
MQLGKRQHAAREKATAVETRLRKNNKATDHAAKTAQQEAVKSRRQNEWNRESSKVTSAITTSHCAATMITGSDDNDRRVPGEASGINKDWSAGSRRRRSRQTGMKESSVHTAEKQSKGRQEMENRACLRIKTNETTQKKGNRDQEKSVLERKDWKKQGK